MNKFLSFHHNSTIGSSKNIKYKKMIIIFTIQYWLTKHLNQRSLNSDLEMLIKIESHLMFLNNFLCNSQLAAIFCTWCFSFRIFSCIPIYKFFLLYFVAVSLICYSKIPKKQCLNLLEANLCEKFLNLRS